MSVNSSQFKFKTLETNEFHEPHNMKILNNNDNNNKHDKKNNTMTTHTHMLIYKLSYSIVRNCKRNEQEKKLIHKSHMYSGVFVIVASLFLLSFFLRCDIRRELLAGTQNFRQKYVSGCI